MHENKCCPFPITLIYAVITIKTAFLTFSLKSSKMLSSCFEPKNCNITKKNCLYYLLQIMLSYCFEGKQYSLLPNFFDHHKNTKSKVSFGDCQP